MKEKIDLLKKIGLNEVQIMKFLPTISLVELSQLEDLSSVLENEKIDFKGHMIKLSFLEKDLLKSNINNKEQLEKDPMALFEQGNAKTPEVKNDKVVSNKQELETKTLDIEQILSENSKLALNEETFERYEHLDELITNIITSLNDEVSLDPVQINDNLIKLVVNKVDDDLLVLISSILYGTELSQEEKDIVTTVIKEELLKTKEPNQLERGIA